MGRERKRYEPGDVISIRTKKDTPSFLFDLINQVSEQEGNTGLLKYLVKGIQDEMAQRKRGLFIPLPPDLRPEEIEKIENNEQLLTLLGNMAKSAVSFEHPFVIHLSGDELSGQEEKREQPADDPEPEPPKPKRNLNNLKKFSSMKKAFD